MLYRTKILDAQGNVIKKGRWRRSKSLVIAWLLHHRAQMKSSVDATIMDITDTNRSVSDLSENLRLTGTAYEDDQGIVVGSGTGAESNTDNKLGTRITNGVGAGNLVFGGQEISSVLKVSGNYDLHLTRRFANNSGGNVTVNEIGIYCERGTWEFCLARDKLPSGDVIGDTEGYVVEYILRISL
jgi:hypothetical protein